MELGLDRLPWYGQIGVFVLVPVAGLLAFRMSWVGPRTDEIELRQQELNQKRVEVARAQQHAGRLPALREAVGEIERRLDELQVVLPSEKDAGTLLRRLQDLAAETNLSIRAFTPQAATVEDLHAAWPSRLELAGTYHNLGLFLDRVSKVSQVINVSDLQIRALDPPQPNATMTAECTATTFVLHETSAEADDPEEVDPEA